jgi:hypothetical protein
MFGSVIFQTPWSKNGEPPTTAASSIAVNSVSLQRNFVAPLSVDLTDDDPAFIKDCNNGINCDINFQEWGAIHLVPSDHKNNDRLSLAMALIDTLADDDPFTNLLIVMPSVSLYTNTLDILGKEMGSVGLKNGAG